MSRSSRFIAISGLVFSLVAALLPWEALQRLGASANRPLQRHCANSRPRSGDNSKVSSGASFGFR